MRTTRAASGTMAGVMLSFWSVLAMRDAAGLSLDVVVLAVALAMTAGRILPGLVPAARVAGLLATPLAAIVATEVGVLIRSHPSAGDAVLVISLSAAAWGHPVGPGASRGR